MSKTFSFILILLVTAFPLGVLQAAEVPEVTAEELTLDKCLELVYQNSQQLKLAAENVTLAKEIVREAKSKFWPLGTYEYGYQNASQGDLWFINPLTMDWQRKPEKGYGGSATLTQPLYTGGKLTANLAIAKQQLAAALEDERKAKQLLNFSIKEAYYGVWLANQVLKVAESSYENMEQHVLQIQNLRRVGTGSKFDLLQAQVQRDRLKPLVIKAGNQLALSKLTLATLIGFDKARQFSVIYDCNLAAIPSKSDLAIDDVLAQAYQKRPEMCQLKQMLNINQEQQKIAKSGYLPEMALSYEYKAEGEEAEIADETKWIFTIGLSGIFFDGFGTQARINQAKTCLRMTKFKAADLQDRIRLEVEQSIQTLAESLETIRANRASIDLAKESLRMTKIRYTAGLATTMDVVDAQLALDQTFNGYYEGIYNYIIADARMDLVIGRDS